MSATATPGKLLVSPRDHTLIMIDFQSQMSFATHSIDAITLRNNAGLVARAAASFKVPTILTTVAEKSFSGPMFAEVTDPFPGQELLDRTSMNTWEDAAVIKQVNAIGRDRLVLAVDEACTNIIRHGYGTQREGDIALRILRTGPMLSFELTDSAPSIDPARVRPRPLGECRCGGFGIALIDEVMDDWRIEPAKGGRGNRLILRKRIDDIGGDEGHEA